MGWSGGDRAEAAFAVVEVAERGGKVGLIEVGPHAGCEDEFRVCRFPEQEIGDALLSARSDEQVDVAAVCSECLGNDRAYLVRRE